jgi:hypothetical protein
MLTEHTARALLRCMGRDNARRAFDAVLDGYRLPDEPAEVISLALREHWRAQHGNTTAWDTAARASGFDPAVYERS